ncbi:uncharacterized protein LOC113559254 [Rhopalosiphum maidis]|uniref:uncharacterized protein LOC113559254 n=1 Tax=Rhopalosiphum maidis TaxID=43146 RepID=UPI000EFE5234|nr:uncharacterized protein LOC113559254 [Rhopalosiphum maidis]
MNTVRLTDTHLLPTRTQRIRMAGYAMAIAVSLACGGMIMQAQSRYRAFLYNAKLTIHGWSGKDNRTRLLNEIFEYQTENCVNTFMNNPLLLIGLAMCIRAAVFGMQSQRLVDIRIFLIWYDVWCLVRSMITSLQFTNCYLNVYYNISKLSMDDYFRNSFQQSVQPYYEVSILLFWALSWLCTMNFILSFCRSTRDNDENWVDCKEKWVDIPVIWFYDYVKIKIKRRRPAVLRSLISRRRRTATTRRLRTKYLLSEWIKKIF